MFLFSNLGLTQTVVSQFSSKMAPFSSTSWPGVTTNTVRCLINLIYMSFSPICCRCAPAIGQTIAHIVIISSAMLGQEVPCHRTSPFLSAVISHPLPIYKFSKTKVLYNLAFFGLAMYGLIWFWLENFDIFWAGSLTLSFFRKIL
jgi:hypothetical protein